MFYTGVNLVNKCRNLEHTLFMHENWRTEMNAIAAFTPRNGVANKIWSLNEDSRYFLLYEPEWNDVAGSVVQLLVGLKNGGSGSGCPSALPTWWLTLFLASCCCLPQVHWAWVHESNGVPSHAFHLNSKQRGIEYSIRGLVSTAAVQLFVLSMWMHEKRASEVETQLEITVKASRMSHTSQCNS